MKYILVIDHIATGGAERILIVWGTERNVY